MSNFAPVVDRIRIIPRPSDFLSRNSGSSGEVFFNRETNSLRVYSGNAVGGFEIARADLSNIDNAVFAQKITEVGETESGSTALGVAVGDTTPEEFINGSLWLNSESGVLYVYINDGNSEQWVQPAPRIADFDQNLTALDFPSDPTVGDTYASDSITWQWDGAAWSILEQAGSNGTTAFSTISVPGESTLTADTDNTLTISAGSNVSITTDSTNNIITISATSEGEASEQNLFSTFSGDSGSVTASSPADTLTISGGTGITTSLSGSTLTITQSEQITTFSALTEANNAGLTIDQIYEPAVVMFRVNNVSTQAYTFQPHHDGENPEIYVLSGATAAFDLSEISGHPFALQDSIGNNLTEGIIHVATDGTVSTGADAQGKVSGTLYWRIKETLFGTYRYQCLNHAAMVGPITIKRFSLI